MSEADLQGTIIQIAHENKWLVAHFRTVRVQRADGSVYYATPVAADGEGFPDLVLVRDRVLFVEVKRENGILEPLQKEWMRALLTGGAEHFTWRPSDLENIRRVLSRPIQQREPGKSATEVYHEGVPK